MILENLFESLPVGIIAFNNKEEIFDINNSGEKILGLNGNQIKGKRWEELSLNSVKEDGTIFPYEEHPVVLALRKKQEIHNVVMGVFNCHKKNHVWISINAVPGSCSKTDSSVFLTLTDVSNR
ncbi:MAG: PAS domain-containing protein [Bacteroidota bacterium]